MEAPITVKKVSYNALPVLKPELLFHKAQCGDFVAIRPCDEEFKGKTFLGVLLGEMALGLACNHNPETGELIITRGHYNPAIYIPEIQRVVFGYESFWGSIKGPEHLREITNEDIKNVWYIQALKQLEKQRANENQPD